MQTIATASITIWLRSRSTELRIQALEAIRTMPDPSGFLDEVRELAKSTKSSAVFNAALETLWGINIDAYIEAQRTNQMGDLSPVNRYRRTDLTSAMVVYGD